MNILEKRELENMKLFYEYIDKEACPTSFAIASGLLYFRDDNSIIRSAYFVNDTNEMNYSKVETIDLTGNYKYISKLDKFLPGIRIALKEENINKNLIYDKMIVNSDIFVLEYGYFPKGRIDYAYTKVDTGVKIKLPVSKYALTKPEYEEFSIYKDEIKDYYYIKYRVNSMTRIENKDFIPGEVGLFKIEPIRFWVDNNSKTLISQDIILGGVPYKLPNDDPYQYDDYYESDLYKAVNIVDEDINILDKLINKKEKVKKKIL